MLSALFFLLLLCTDGSTLEIRHFPLDSSFQKRLHGDRMGSTVLMADPGNENERKSTNREDIIMKRLFEGMVRSVTGETDYEFGELGEKPLSENNETYKYQFGDITKSILAEITHSDDAGQYRDKREQALQQLTGVPLKDKDLPIDMLETIFSRLGKKQRINLILAGCQLGAEGVVLWGLLTNLCTLITAALAWISSLDVVRSAVGVAAAPPPLLPFNIDKELWRSFAAKYTGFDLVLSPVFLIAKAVLMLFCFRRYHSFVNRLSTTPLVAARGWVRRYNSAVLQKALAVIAGFFITNIVLSGITSALVFALIGLFFRVCLL